MTNVIYLCGPHCAGKTTILKELLKRNLIAYRGSEIGKDLFYKRIFLPGEQTDDFEFEVTKAELERDREIVEKNVFAAVETWHPGNLAYALARNPACKDALIMRMKNSPLLKESYGIWLRVSHDEIYERTITFKKDRQWAAAFYTKIDGLMEHCIGCLGLSERVSILDANIALAQVKEMVIKIVTEQSAR